MSLNITFSRFLSILVLFLPIDCQSYHTYLKKHNLIPSLILLLISHFPPSPTSKSVFPFAFVMQHESREAKCPRPVSILSFFTIKTCRLKANSRHCFYFCRNFGEVFSQSKRHSNCKNRIKVQFSCFSF